MALASDIDDASKKRRVKRIQKPPRFVSMHMVSLLRTLFVAMLLTAAFSLNASESPSVAWKRTWNPAPLFDEARHERRFVLLDLHAVWCHWCHVMDEQTYGDPTVRALIAQHYVAVSIDADSDPSLASRYGDWGWPATIVLAADGTEIVKRRGFIAPAQMASLLQAIIDDPTPGPSVGADVPLASANAGGLSPRQRATLEDKYDALYDETYGGWGTAYKFVDETTLEYTLALLEDKNTRDTASRRARQTLDSNLTLIDPVWGGVYQYSDQVDWKSPHYEKLLAFQADDLRVYSLAWSQWHDARYLNAAQALYRYLVGFLASPEGAFYVSQDADLSAAVTGHTYYSLDDHARRGLGVPRVDTHLYARENGWVIRALAEYSMSPVTLARWHKPCALRSGLLRTAVFRAVGSGTTRPITGVLISKTPYTWATLFWRFTALPAIGAISAKPRVR